MDMLISVNGSFEYKLPLLPMQEKVAGRDDKRTKKDREARNVPYHSVKASSRSTAAAQAIGGYIHDDVQHLRELAEAKLQGAIQLRDFMPGIEKTYLLANEADVVRASGQHLVYPINMLLPELFPGISLKIICNSEVSENQESRFDMRWLSCRPGQPAVIVAILEYKTTRVLHRWEFEDGMFQPGLVEKGMKDAQNQPNETFFRGNAVPVSLQASKYSEVCKDIALFDWSAMMVLDLNTWNPDENLAPRGAFYEESKEDGNFRKVLLGFLLRALSRHL